MASAFSRWGLRWAAGAVLAAGLCACGVHKPSETQFQASASTDDSQRAEVQLDGGPDAQASSSEGFELVGGPAGRPAPARTARPTETVGGFQLTAASDASVTRQASASTSSPAEAGAMAAADRNVADPDPNPAPSPAVPSALLHKVSNPGPSAGVQSQQFNAFALWPLTIQPGADAPEKAQAVRAGSPIEPGRIFMFVLVLVAVAALWWWHGHERARLTSAPGAKARTAT
jgi:hypothetical protein